MENQHPDYNEDEHRYVCKECRRSHPTEMHQSVVERFPVALRADRCPHEDFFTAVNVARLTDIGAFFADIRITCVQCDTPFEFIGPEPGLSPERPMVDPSSQELRAPIRPKGSQVMPAMPGFSVRAN